MPAEPTQMALLLSIFGVLMLVSVLFSPASGRLGIPVALLFLAIGMLAGSEGLGGIAFADYPLMFRLGTVALALILFDGGLNTSVSSFKEGLAGAGLLATVGVVGTAALVSLGAHFFGLQWTRSEERRVGKECRL